MKFYIFSLFKRLNLLFPLDILVLHECIVTLWPKVIISLGIFSAKMKEIFIELDHPGSLRGHDENSVKMFSHQLSWTDARDGPKTLAEEVRSTVRPTYNIHQHHVSKYILFSQRRESFRTSRNARSGIEIKMQRNHLDFTSLALE